jgi:hypothetical protein
MANRKVRVVRSVKLDGKWKFLTLERGRKLRIPNTEGRWYISWREGSRTRWERAKDYSDAYMRQLKKNAELHATAFGVHVKPETTDRMRVEKAFDEFIKDQELLERAVKTVDAYRAVKRTFLKSCKRQFLDEIERRDLLEYAAYLRKVEKLSPRTVHTGSAHHWTLINCQHGVARSTQAVALAGLCQLSDYRCEDSGTTECANSDRPASIPEARFASNEVGSVVVESPRYQIRKPGTSLLACNWRYGREQQTETGLD